jgi:insulysin
MRSTSLPTWHFEELKALQEISFRFSQMQRADSYVTKLAENLLREWAKEDLLCASRLMWNYDDKLVRDLLERELAPGAGTVMITAKDFSSIGMAEGWQKEKWYGTEYIVQPLDPKILEKVLSACSVLGLPMLTLERH